MAIVIATLRRRKISVRPHARPPLMADVVIDRPAGAPARAP
jgi:hypothetical protein